MVMMLDLQSTGHGFDLLLGPIRCLLLFWVSGKPSLAVIKARSIHLYWVAGTVTLFDSTWRLNAS